MPSTSCSLMVVGMASAVLVPLAAAMGDVHFEFEATVNLVLVATLSTALGYVLLYRLIDELGPQRASLSSYLAPGFSVLLAAIALSESIGAGAIVGLVLIVSGVALGSVGASRDKRFG